MALKQLEDQVKQYDSEQNEKEKKEKTESVERAKNGRSYLEDPTHGGAKIAADKVTPFPLAALPPLAAPEKAAIIPSFVAAAAPVAVTPVAAPIVTAPVAVPTIVTAPAPA